jgi:hypothetical protein
MRKGRGYYGRKDSPTLTAVLPSSSEYLLPTGPPCLLLTLILLELRFGRTMVLIGRCFTAAGDAGGEVAMLPLRRVRDQCVAAQRAEKLGAMPRGGRVCFDRIVRSWSAAERDVRRRPWVEIEVDGEVESKGGAR